MNLQLIERSVFVVRVYNVRSELFMLLCSTDPRLPDLVLLLWVSDLSTISFTAKYSYVADSRQQSHVRKCLR